MFENIARMTVATLFLLALSSFQPISSVSAGEDYSEFIKGATMSHVSERENDGFVYKENGTAIDPFQTLAKNGANYAQFDLWTSNSFRGLEDVKALALRAHRAGLKISINFFYSDNYLANIPEGWPTEIEPLKEKVYTYTTTVLQELDAQGTRPSMVKIGNEIDGTYRDGFLNPTGQKSTNYNNFIALLKEGIRATRDFDPNIKIMIHSADKNQYNNEVFYQGLINNNVDFDIIALSYYQTTQGDLNNLRSNLTYLASKFDKKILITETAYPWTDYNYDDQKNGMPTESGYPHTVAGQYSYLRDMMDIVAKTPGNKGIGVLVWPGAYTATANLKSTWDNSAFWDSKTGNAVPSIAVWKAKVSIGSGVQNIIKNSGFEADSVQTQTPSDWITWSLDGKDDDADYTEPGGASGNFRATHWKSTDYEVATIQTRTMLPDGKYTLKAWVRSSGGQTIAVMEAMDFGGILDYKWVNIPATSTWKQIVIPDINVTNGRCKIRFYSVAKANQWMSFDNVEFYKED